MNGPDSKPTPVPQNNEPGPVDRTASPPTAQALRQQRRESLRWWLKLLIQPLLLLAAGALLLAGLGLSQRLGWVPGSSVTHAPNAGSESVRYICPMMCTPPQSQPGRCPVCGMELVRAAASSGAGHSDFVQIGAAARRVADIRTAPVKLMAASRTIRAIGELSYDEGSRKTISAYVDGRIERLYADYTGVVVQKGDQLALIYSPRLYSGQVEYLLAKKNYGNGGSSTLKRIAPAGGDLHASARQRLIEYGMTPEQIASLEQTGQANSRLHLSAPIGGTVIEKLAAEGDYVKEGQPIYRLADLSTVWLMLELFPDDAASIYYGQKVEASVQSLSGKTFTGRVAFVDPNVNPVTRTVGVRVVVPNPDGLLRVGDYAKASIETPIGTGVDGKPRIYDEDLADKWISPRHPHVIQSRPGTCSVCGVDLVPAADFGFTADPKASQQVLMVPRDAVLMAGDNSVVYVEVESGHFEIRRVTVGPTSGNLIAVLDGLEEDEQVAVRGNFLIDSQMQLAGNPSLIDPSKLKPSSGEDALSPDVIEALAKLSDEDRVLATSQRICPVTKMQLGSMGTPPKVEVNGRVVFLCCIGCKGPLLEDPDKYLANLDAPAADEIPQDPAIAAALRELSPEDRALAQRQRICPVADTLLGSMGTPEKVDVNGTPVFICCGGCRERLLKDPEKYLAKLARLEAERVSAELPAMDLPPMDFPPIEVPQEIVETDDATQASEFPSSAGCRDSMHPRRRADDPQAAGLLHS